MSRLRQPWAIAIALLAGCAGPPAPQATPAVEPATPSTGTTVYTCADSFRFSARPRNDSIVVSFPEGAVTLPRVTAASGARYSGGGVTFWSKGPEASLERQGGTRSACQGRPAGTPWEEALLLGIDFRAVGQEPGWVLDIDEGRWIRYVGDYGSATVFASAPAAEPVPSGGVTYRARSDGGRELLVTIRETRCQDAMSGESFSHTVSVRLDGREVDGCGRPLLSGDMTERYWKLVELDGKPAVAGRAAREAHLRADRAAVVGDDMTLYAGDQVLAGFAAVYLR